MDTDDDPVISLSAHLLSIIRSDLTASDSVTIFVTLGVIFILLICSMLISASENAFFSVTPQDVEELGKKPTSATKAALNLIGKPKRLLATILIGNNFVNVGIVIVSSVLITNTFDFTFNPAAGFVIQVIVITFLLVMLGEIMPKIYATHHNMVIIKLMALPLVGMRKVFYPLVYLLVKSTAIIDRRISKKGHMVSVDDLNHAIEITSEEDASESEKDILKGIVNFGNVSVKQIMRSRTDVMALEVNMQLDEVLHKVKEWSYSRLPVYEESFDKIVGVLYIKDLLPHLDKQKSYKWQNILRDPLFVPENKKIDDLLSEFQEKRVHMAVVVDEYGGSAGIATMEDILEEIFGEINDEFDDDELKYSKLDEFNFVFEGKTLLNDVFRITDVNGDDFEEMREDADTIGGLVQEILGNMPEKGEKIDYNGYTFIVESVDERRVKRVKMIIPQTSKKNE